MKKIATLSLLVASCFISKAQISITGGTLNYSQDFDNLDTAVYNAASNPGSTNLPNGWSIFEYGSSTSRVNNGYVADYGSSTAGDTYSYGSAGTTERALGSLSSNSLSSQYGAKFVNNTGSVITGFTLTYKGEQWRFGSTGRTNLDSLQFYYSTSADSVSDTTAGKFIADVGLALNSPNIAGSTGAMNGNASGNFTVKSGSITGLSIPGGGKLIIKWIDRNIVGSDDGLAVDSVRITFTLGGTSLPRPAIVSLSPANNATNVLPNSNLVITFDHNVVKGAGDIRIKNTTTQTVNTINASDANVSVSGKTVTITGNSFVLGNVYHVTIDSTAFDASSFHSYGLYDTTAWKFTIIKDFGVRNLSGKLIPMSIVNPVDHGNFVLLVTLPKSGSLRAIIFDLAGRKLSTQEFNGIKGENRFYMHKLLPAGTYMIRIDDNESYGSTKAVIE